MQAERLFIGNVPCVVYRPNKFDSTKKYPVFLFMHGKGEWAETPMKDPAISLYNNGNNANLLTNGDAREFIVVAPQLVLSLNDWVPGWTDKYLDSVYNYILKNNFTDLNHIKVTGLSLGGGGVYVVCTGPFAPHVSAAIPICGTAQYNQDFSVVGHYSIPLWAFHAKNDTIADPVHTVNIVNKINSYSPNPKAKYTLLDSGGHYIWGDIYSRKEMYDWALSQSNAPIVAPPAPTPIESFKPTHIIRRIDGSSEQVRIETI
jgi:predicted peptidase